MLGNTIMSALGQKQTCAAHKPYVRFAPKADIVPITSLARALGHQPLLNFVA